MPLGELEELFTAAGLGNLRRAFYRLEFELEQVLQGSHPRPGDADKVRETFAAALSTDALGLDTRRVGDQIRFAYPIAVLCADVGP
jgi:hypothetical protein